MAKRNDLGSGSLLRYWVDFIVVTGVSRLPRCLKIGPKPGSLGGVGEKAAKAAKLWVYGCVCRVDARDRRGFAARPPTTIAANVALPTVCTMASRRSQPIIAALPQEAVSREGEWQPS